jgi:hypothetical protein
MSPKIVLPVLAALALGAAGCGSSNNSNTTSTGGSATTAQRGYGSPVPTAQAYVDAFAAKDYAKACSYIATNTLAQITQSGKYKCTFVFEHGGAKIAQTVAFFAGGAKVSSPHVNGTNATVKITSASGKVITVPLVQESGTWKVAS